MNPLTMEIGVDTGGEYAQHGEVAIVMTTEQADKLAELLDHHRDIIHSNDETAADLAYLLVTAIKEARHA